MSHIMAFDDICVNPRAPEPNGFYFHGKLQLLMVKKYKFRDVYECAVASLTEKSLAV